MEILNSGSFVPLDNREKIEQLIFTAKTLATEVSGTEGFQSSGPANYQLGLEMWKGAEYVCRDHEEVTIRNLFLSKFLEKLREIERQTPEVSKAAQTQITVHQADSVPNHNIAQPPSPQFDVDERPEEAARDEYLGLVAHDAAIESERPSYANECLPEAEAEIAAMYDGADAIDIATERFEKSQEDSPKEAATSTVSVSEEPGSNGAAESEVSALDVSASTDESRDYELDSANLQERSEAAIASIVLQEKEPYNFDSCTVTAVIQLLPEKDGVRKCVVSLRSHDFVPQITISELRVGEIDENATSFLSEAMNRYRTELPALAAEKIKKEKPGGKKRIAKSNDKAAKASSPPDAKTPVNSTTPLAAQNSEVPKNQQNLFTS